MIIFSSQDIRGAVIVILAFCSLITFAELWRRFGKPKPEWTRKFVHLGGGIVCIFFPVLLKSWLTVLMIALGMSTIFVFASKIGAMRSIHGVRRPSRGSEYYPVAIFLVYVMSHDQYWLYVSSILVLAVADTCAALIGSRYGVVLYEVEKERKSLEGSFVFLVVTFLVIHLPLLLMTDLARAACVMAAFLVAILVTGFEAISIRGADNLIVPVAVCGILSRITTKPLSEITFRLISLVTLTVVLLIVSRKSRIFNIGGTIVFILFSYGAWSLGSIDWALPVFIGYLLYIVAAAITPAGIPGDRVVKVRVMVRAVLIPFLFLLGGNITRNYVYFAPYLTCCAAALGFSLLMKIAPFNIEGWWRRRAFPSLIGALGALSVIVLMWAILPVVPVKTPIVMATVSAIAILIQTIKMPPIKHVIRTDDMWGPSNFILTFTSGLVILALQRADAIPVWNLEP